MIRGVICFLMGYAVVGTAGHVDHGKTELVKALTGIDTDRLLEEKRRGISIELGFAFMNLPGGHTAAFIDVPGHEKFIRQMIAGAGGMEVFMLVVAADEGIMPQTMEHMDIINILGIRHGLCAVTKADLVSSKRLEVVVNEVKEYLYDIYKKEFPVISVSAKTGSGLNDLIIELAKIIEGLPQRDPGLYLRMPVDRVFTKKGVGTVIAGTIWSGSVGPGDIVEIIPSKASVRVKNVQVHGRDVSKAYRGQRAALNITGLSKEEVKRGVTVQTPGYIEELSTLMDGELTLLEDDKRPIKPIKNMERVRFYHGTAEIFGRVVLLDRDMLKPGEKGYVQFLLESPLAALPSDRYIIRTYSPQVTIGGGAILLPGAPRRKRYDEFSLKILKALHRGSLEEKAEALAVSTPHGLVDLDRAAKQLGVDGELLRKKACSGEKIRLLGSEKREFLMAQTSFLKLVKKVKKELSDYHKTFPLRAGIPKEELHTLLFKKYGDNEYNVLLKELEREGIVKIDRYIISLKEHEPFPTAKQLKKIKQVEEKLLENPFKPVPWPVIKREIFYFKREEGEEIINYLERMGRVVRVSEEICFHRDAVEKAKEIIKKFLKDHNAITVGEARDLLVSSRKYVVPLLEYLDREGFTKRVGDVRYLNKGN
ncbi:MAG: Selenocysteine-specific translation elongation factor [Clostridia bacterium 41_269]|nr:MAG: Selenocysteine-specific translation elongation factor [Clostridia bacterium 41_269]